MYVSILWIIFAFINSSRIKAFEKISKVQIIKSIIMSILALGFVITAYFGLVKGSIWTLSPWFILPVNGMDIINYKDSAYLFYYLLLNGGSFNPG